MQIKIKSIKEILVDQETLKEIEIQEIEQEQEELMQLQDQIIEISL